MSKIYNFFKFLEEKKGKKIPFEAKLEYGSPEDFTPEDLHIEGGLDLEFSSIKYLPDNLTVDGNLDLSDSTIKYLPNNLKVDGFLSLFRVNINSIPDNLKVEEDLDLTFTPLSEKYTEEEIRKMIEDKGGYVKDEIYV